MSEYCEFFTNAFQLRFYLMYIIQNYSFKTSPTVKKMVTEQVIDMKNWARIPEQYL